MKVVVVDPSLAGISGDMLVAALLDIHGKEERLFELAELIERELDYCSRLEVSVRDVVKRGIKAKDVFLTIDEHVHDVPATEVASKAVEIARSISLSEGAVSFVERVFAELLEAESRVHGVPKSSVHLHELASADTVFDVVGCAVLMDDLGYFTDDTVTYTTPPALGGGHIEIEHGRVWVPAPATLEVLRRHGFRYSSTLVKKELTTPTGAALLVSMTDKVVDFYPPMRVRNVGYGAGKKNLGRIPNLLRIVEGEALEATSDKIVVIETNIDDVPGEIMGYLIERLLQQGALDVSIVQAVGKKNRPAFIVKVLAEFNDYAKLVDTLIAETGTLGVRLMSVSRIVALRERRPVEVTVRGRKFQVRVKTSRIGNMLVNIKPEYDDLKKIAMELGVPLRAVAKEVEAQIARMKPGSEGAG